MDMNKISIFLKENNGQFLFLDASVISCNAKLQMALPHLFVLSYTTDQTTEYTDQTTDQTGQTTNQTDQTANQTDQTTDQTDQTTDQTDQTTN